MARAPRLSLAGELHYVVQRGHNDQGVFADDHDRAEYLDMLRGAAHLHGVAVHAYVLMTSQVHFLATPAAPGALSRLMQSLGRRYVAAFNRRHGRSGTLWSGRFRTGLIDGDAHGLEALMYLESVPTRAGLVTSAADWPWSSAAHHLGRRRDPLISEHSSFWTLGNTPFERESVHAHNLCQDLNRETLEALDSVTQRGGVYGGASFATRIESQSGVKVRSKPRGRPPRVKIRASKQV
jgi:putative transposase